MVTAAHTCRLLVVVAFFWGGAFPALALSYSPECFVDEISAAASDAALATGDECNGKTEDSFLMIFLRFPNVFLNFAMIVI